MNKIEEHLLKLSYIMGEGQRQIHWDDISSFRNNYVRNYKFDFITERVNYLETWKNKIGKQVFKSRDSFSYVTVDEFYLLDSWIQINFDTTVEILFTEELYNTFCNEHMEYQVKRLVEELTEGQLSSNSTNKLTNLVFEWELECKQELLREFKKLWK